jgi:hypothetical protein
MAIRDQCILAKAVAGTEFSQRYIPALPGGKPGNRAAAFANDVKIIPFITLADHGITGTVRHRLKRLYQALDIGWG